jgi:tetratricopeptide (TPR) repeat protein
MILMYATVKRTLPVILTVCLVSIWVSGFASSPAVREAEQLIDAGRDEEAKTVLLGAVGEEPADHEAHMMLARVFLRDQDHKRAIQHAETATKLNDSVPDYHLWLARSYLAKAMESGVINAFRYARKGKGEYEKAIALDSSKVEARLELCLYLVAAPGLVGGDRDRARKEAQIIEVQDSLYGSYAWATIWEREADLDKSEAYLRRAVDLDTSSTFYARYALGYFFERNQKYDEAVEVFKAILAKKPDEMNAVFQVGKICVLTESNLEDAEVCFRRYLEVEAPPNAPDWASAHWRLGMVYDLQGKTDLALAELRKAVELAPDNKEFRKTLKQVEKKKQ